MFCLWLHGQALNQWVQGHKHVKGSSVFILTVVILSILIVVFSSFCSPMSLWLFQGFMYIMFIFFFYFIYFTFIMYLIVVAFVLHWSFYISFGSFLRPFYGCFRTILNMSFILLTPPVFFLLFFFVALCYIDHFCMPLPSCSFKLYQLASYFWTFCFSLETLCISLCLFYIFMVVMCLILVGLHLFFTLEYVFLVYSMYHISRLRPKALDYLDPYFMYPCKG